MIRPFSECEKCGWTALDVRHVAKLVSSLGHPGAAHLPNVPNEDVAKEGFVIRCERCKFTWYELLHPEKDRLGQ